MALYLGYLRLRHTRVQSFQTATPNCHLVTLASGIVLIILGYLHDLDYLFSAVLTRSFMGQ
jgi:hypothetical protein